MKGKRGGGGGGDLFLCAAAICRRKLQLVGSVLARKQRASHTRWTRHWQVLTHGPWGGTLPRRWLFRWTICRCGAIRRTPGLVSGGRSGRRRRAPRLIGPAVDASAETAACKPGGGAPHGSSGAQGRNEPRTVHRSNSARACICD